MRRNLPAVDAASRPMQIAAEVPKSVPVAIIGMACIFAKAPNVQAFWNNILDGVDAVGEPVALWDAQRYLDAGRIKTQFGGYLGDLYRFDPREFGIMPNSIDGGEPDQFLALKVARDALADAGYLGAEFDHTDTGIILGHSTYLHRGQVTVVQTDIVVDQTMAVLKAAMPQLGADKLDAVRKLLLSKVPPMNADTAPGLVPNVMTGRIANRLDLHGPNYLVDAACSSSLLAVGAAIDELRAGRSRMMLAGGVNASLPADVTTIFTQLGALSARGHVRPFETGSDGTLLGEGLGIIVLKRLPDALADGDRVYAVLRGVGQSSDGRGTGLLAPSPDGESLAIRRTYDTAGVDPSTIGLIEAHGTGIPLGDKTEIASLKAVFGERCTRIGTKALGSVKSMISHCIPAAGVASLIKTSLAIHHQTLPPTLCAKVNPELGIERTPFYVNTKTAPWMVRDTAPRRAGVNAFGFGGTNSHAILEEPPREAKRPLRLTRWPAELCLWSAPSLEALIARLETFAKAMVTNPAWRLDEVAAALATVEQNQGSQAHRLAIVVKDVAALAKSVEAAITRLRKEPDAAAWTARGGISYARRRVEGKLAFLFPGEGSQYLGMFADLSMCFEPVRRWLDFWHGLYDLPAGHTRTDIVFPSSEIDDEQKKQLELRMHDMDVGSEAVFIGGMAMHDLLDSLGVKPDAMLGHSSGESAALGASGANPATSAADRAACISKHYAVYEQLLADGKIPTGALLAVGALPIDTVETEVAAAAPDVVIAMDNCSNQTVLYGRPQAVERIHKRLTSLGGICLPVPFDRGYHTPEFAEAGEAFFQYYKAVKLGKPKVPMYSCASADRFPSTVDGVRKLAAAQWAQKVRFRETILKMHDDGVRLFVEVGPSSKLSAFVGDILIDRDHVSLATNVRRKGEVEQLLVVLAQLYVAGRGPDMARLYADRKIAVIDLEASPKPSREQLLDNTLPMIRLDAAAQSSLRELLSSSSSEFFGSGSGSGSVGVAGVVTDRGADQLSKGGAWGEGISGDAAQRDAGSSTATAVPTVPLAEPGFAARGADIAAHSGAGNTPLVSNWASRSSPDAGNAPEETSAVMADYFDLMRGFLESQQALMQGLNPSALHVDDDLSSAHEDLSGESLSGFKSFSSHVKNSSTPLLDQVIEHDAAHLVATCQVSLLNDNFIRDHTMSGAVSGSDPELFGLSCVPFSVSLELMAEACAVLAGSTAVCCIENVRAFDWAALDEGELVLTVHARVLDSATGRFSAQVSTPQGPTISAEFVFAVASQAPEWRIPAVAPLSDPQESYLNSPHLYATGMFHGPVFQSMSYVQAWDHSGIDVELSPVSLRHFFAQGHVPQLVLNPVLLDAMGQVVACWLVQYVGTEFHAFPSTIQRIELFEPCPSDREGVLLRMRQRPVDGSSTDIQTPRAWSFECTDGEGRVLMRGQDLVNLFFRVPVAYHEARTDPLAGRIGEALAPIDGATAFTALWRVPMMPEDFCTQSGSIGLRILAHALLARSERDTWRTLPGQAKRRREWLFGRIAIKEVVRQWIWEQTGSMLYPSDVVVSQDAHGAPLVSGWWTESLIAAPQVSLSHDPGTCLAALNPAERVGVDLEALGRIRNPALMADALASIEKARLQGMADEVRDEALLRMWVAKEAAAKCLGLGMQGRPQDFVVTSADDTFEQLLVRHPQGHFDATVVREDAHVMAVAKRIEAVAEPEANDEAFGANLATETALGPEAQH